MKSLEMKIAKADNGYIVIANNPDYGKIDLSTGKTPDEPYEFKKIFSDLKEVTEYLYGYFK